MNWKYQKRKFVIVGLGKSGRSAEKFLLFKNIPPEDILTFDEKDPSANLKNWSDLFYLPAGYLVVSPGVPLQKDELQKLLKLGWELTSEINLACSVLTDELIIGITGSVGKSTTTSLLGEAVKKVDPLAFVGGNLGTPFCDYALQVLQHQKRARYVVLELSSYQLENCSDLQLDFSAITYLSANHLERYSSLEEYYQTKCSIAQRTRSAVVINSSCRDLLKYENHLKSLTTASVLESGFWQESIALIGLHNLENYSVAFKLAQLCKLPASSLSTLKSYTGLEHRLQSLGLFEGVLYINDSKATAMDSVLVASEGALNKVGTKIGSQGFLYLLLGGKDKNLPWENLNILKDKKNMRFIFFGQCRQTAQSKSGLEGPSFLTLSQAVDYVLGSVQAGDVVLLSPGGTSLDEFKNFEERGHFFKQKIQDYYSVK